MERRKRGLGWVIGIAVVLALAVGGYFLGRIQSDAVNSEMLQATLAETDQADPGWRWEQLYDGRPLVPEHENGAKIAAQLTNIQTGVAWKNAMERLNPARQPANRLLSEEDRTLLTEGLAAEPKLVELAEALASRPHLHADLILPPDVISVLLPHTQGYRPAANVLCLQALLAIDRGDADQAVKQIASLFLLGDAVGEEPLLISQLVRLAMYREGHLTLERLLGCTSEPIDWGPLEAQLTRTLQGDAMTLALRGERATIHRLFENIETRDVDLDEMLEEMEAHSADRSWWDHVVDFTYGPDVPFNHAVYLQYMNRYLAVLERPMPEWFEALAAIDFPPQDREHVLVSLFLPAVEKIFAVEQRSTAELRSAQVALACEQFRQANQRWPHSIDELTPMWLGEVPMDPFDGESLRWRRLDDGIVIYSVGSDLIDAGGNLDRKAGVTEGVDFGFRLWDVDQRRLPALPLDENDPALVPED